MFDVNINVAALAATLGIEAFALTVLFPFIQINQSRLICLSIIINFITQPIFTLWLKYVTYGQDYNWPYYFIVGEIAVIACEALFYFYTLQPHGKKLIACAVISIWSNLLSLTIGLFLPI